MLVCSLFCPLLVLPLYIFRDLAKMFAAHLRHIGQGSWQGDGSSERLPTTELELELWSTKVTGGGYIIWQVGAQGWSQDYSLQVACAPSGRDTPTLKTLPS